MKKCASDRVGKKVCKRTGVCAILAAVLLAWVFAPVAAGTAYAASGAAEYNVVLAGSDTDVGSTEVDLEEMFSGVKEQITDALEQIDTETAKEMFDFLQEKIADGSLKTEDGIKAAIEEAESKFDVSVDEATARTVVDTMEKLEGMGFSAEELVEKAKGLYEQYGADFIDHANEAISEVVEEAVTKAVDGFFESIWEGAKNFFQNLFSGF